MTVNLHSEITYNKEDDPTTDKESDIGYNDKVVHADVTFNEYTKPGGAGSIDSGTLEELQILVAGAKKAASTAVAASEDAALSRNASQANADSASTSATAAQDSAGRAESAAIRAEEAAERAEQAGGSGGGSSSGGTLDEETLQQIHDFVDEAKTAATNASGSADSAAESASNAKTSEVNAGVSADRAESASNAASEASSSAEDSATAASTSADNASASALEAKNYSDAAKESATKASGSATSASDLAKQAASSAATSASNASSSARAASTSATNAAKSASDAKAYLDQMADVTIDLSKVSGVLDVAHGGTGQSTEAGLKAYLEGLGFSTSSGSSIDLPLSIAQGGTGATTADAAWTALGGGSIGKLNTINLTANVSGTLPVANGGTGVTSLDELKTALGITDPGTGGGESSGEVFELTEVTTFDFKNPTPGQYMTTLAKMTNAPSEWDMADSASGDWASWSTTQGILVRCWKANIPGYKGGYYADFIRFPIQVLNKSASMGSGSGELRVVRGIAYYKSSSATSLTWQFRNDAW